MIKFIVLFSLALAGHKARGLMLRGSGQILQRPNFINSESQLDAKKSFLQIDKKNGKSLLRKTSYLQQDEDKQEQSYLQGKKEDKKEIKMMWAELNKDRNWSEENIDKGLDLMYPFLTKDQSFFRKKTKRYYKRLILRLARWSPPSEAVLDRLNLDQINQVGGGSQLSSNAEKLANRILISMPRYKKLSLRRKFFLKGSKNRQRNKAITEMLGRVNTEKGKQWSKENILKGLDRVFPFLTEETIFKRSKMLHHLLTKISEGSDADLGYLGKIHDLGSGKIPASDAKALAEELTKQVLFLEEPEFA